MTYGLFQCLLRARSLLRRLSGLLLVLALPSAFTTAVPPTVPQPLPLASVDALSSRLADLPLAFEPDLAPADGATAFLARIPHGSLLFGPDGVHIFLDAPGVPRPQPWYEAPALPEPTAPTHLRLSWEDANPSPALKASNQLPGVVNYLLGNDPSQWRTGVPTYADITYQDLYPGIDLQYNGGARGLKGTYVVAPGADPSRIRWRYEGAGRPALDGAGNVQLSAGGSALSSRQSVLLTEEAPVAWQVDAGEQTPVDARFSVAEDGTIGFVLESYDRSQPLILDPYLLYSIPLGYASTNGYGVAVDASGAVYMTGETTGSHYPVVDPIQPSFGGLSDVVVSKLNPEGTALVFSTYLGAGDFDRGLGIALDAAGRIYLTGAAESRDFPVTAGAYQTTQNGVSNAFFAVLNPRGAALLYSTFLGGDAVDLGWSIAVTPDGWATIAGRAQSSPFPTRRTLYPWQLGRGGFVAHFSPTGELDYSMVIPATWSAYGVALDAGGNAYVAGEIHQEGLPVFNAVQPAYGGGTSDAFVVALAADGSHGLYTTYLGGSAEDVGRAIAVDVGGQATVGGWT